MKDYEEGLKQKDIANKYHISDSRVSQIVGSIGIWKEKGKVNIFDKPINLGLIFEISLLDGLFETSILELRKQGVFIRKHDYATDISLLAFFPKEFFGMYEVKEEIDVLCTEELHKFFDTKKTEPWEIYGDNISVSFNEEEVKVGAVGDKIAEFTHSFGVVPKSSYPVDLKLDEDGFWKESEFRISFHPEHFVGMGTQDNICLQVRNENENEKLTVYCKMANKWLAKKEIPQFEIVGEHYPLKIFLNSTHFSTIMKLSKRVWNSFNDKPKGPVWLCFNKKFNIVYISLVPDDKSIDSYPHPWFVHFILGAQSGWIF